MTEPGHIWRQIEELMAGARGQVTLVAPFIKREILAATLSALPATVEDIECITRWVPEEVAAGVSDPEIIELAEEDKRLRIALCSSLHAKLYLSGERCLIGSANLTGKATGRVPNANIEILVEAPATHPEIIRVLTEIEARAIEATPHMADLVRRQADLLKEHRPTASDQPREEALQGWYPVTRRPEAIYPYYCGRAQFGRSVEAAILRDLALLGMPAGLSETEFSDVIEDRLRKIPALQALVAGDRLSNVELQYALQEQTSMTDEQARRTTETIAAWLRYFGRFYTDVGTWEIRHGQELH
ncbi:phospholipase D family protein [Streptomyces sp. JV184]|uniref:phospholipase D family protein n=1 Tax=Streptomyces sp. JV184 TaxID=858637 RepID=UPI002E77ED00|nr:phospholipase D family protein [Streptomyces sp. JV184]MEE1748720.1 phospholipase D family protein [Streptomyces sp. JV184]